jgi:hypothetical protein
MTMKHVPMHLQPERVVTALAEAVMDLLITPDGTVVIDYPSATLWGGMYLLAEASRRLGVPDWMALFATPLAAWPLPLPPELQVNEALITMEHRRRSSATRPKRRTGEQTWTSSNDATETCRLCWKIW